MRRFLLVEKGEVLGVSAKVNLGEGVHFTTDEVAIRYRGKLHLLSWWNTLESFSSINCACESPNEIEWIDP